MASVQRGLAWTFGLLLDPFAAFSPLVGLTLISAVSGILLLFAFKYTSDPKAIRAAKQKTQAHLLAVRLYKDDLTVVFRSQLSLLRSLGAYMGNMMLPFFAIVVPFALLFGHLDARYGARALHPGERVLVKAVATPESRLDGWRLEGAEGVVVDSPPVRIPSRGEIDWRLRATTPGTYEIALVDGNRRVAKVVRVAAREVGAAPRRSVAGFEALFLAPIEAPIDPASGLESIDVTYPAMSLPVLGWDLHWIVVFLVVSAAVAWFLRKRAGVEF